MAKRKCEGVAAETAETETSKSVALALQVFDDMFQPKSSSPKKAAKRSLKREGSDASAVDFRGGGGDNAPMINTPYPACLKETVESIVEEILQDPVAAEKAEFKEAKEKRFALRDHG